MIKYIKSFFGPKWNPWSKPICTYNKYIQIRFRISDNLMQTRECISFIDLNKSQFDDAVNKSMDPLFKVNYR